MGIRVAAELYCEDRASLSVLALLADRAGDGADQDLAEGLARIAERRRIGEIDETEAQTEVAKLLKR